MAVQHSVAPSGTWHHTFFTMEGMLSQAGPAGQLSSTTPNMQISPSEDLEPEGGTRQFTDAN